MAHRIIDIIRLKTKWSRLTKTRNLTLHPVGLMFDEEEFPQPAVYDSYDDFTELFDHFGLTHKEKEIYKMYYLENRNMAEIGRIIGLTESRVHQILTKAKPHVKNYYETKKLRRA